MIRPDHIPIDIFLNEIPYYREGISYFLFKLKLDLKCNKRLSVKAISQMLDYEGLLYENEEKVEVATLTGWSLLRHQMWNLFESPESGNMARFVSLISVTAIIASTTIFCLETLPAFKDDEECNKQCKISTYNSTDVDCQCEVSRDIHSDTLNYFSTMRLILKVSGNICPWTR